VLEVVNDFLWSSNLINKPLKELPIRTPGITNRDSFRLIEHIPIEEIQAAMFLILNHAVGINIENLLVETSKLFGFGRMTENIRSYLEKSYDNLLVDDLIDEKDGLISIRC